MLISVRVGSEIQILERGSGRHSPSKFLKCHRHLALSGWDSVTHVTKLTLWKIVNGMQLSEDAFSTRAIPILVCGIDPSWIDPKYILFFVCRRFILNSLYDGSNFLQVCLYLLLGCNSREVGQWSIRRVIAAYIYLGCDRLVCCDWVSLV